jgi:hypothetical protein
MDTIQKTETGQQISGALRAPLPENKQEMATGFFEMSKVVDSPEMLHSWVEWFKSLNIPCLVVKRKNEN